MEAILKSNWKYIFWDFNWVSTQGVSVINETTGNKSITFDKFNQISNSEKLYQF